MSKKEKEKSSRKYVVKKKDFGNIVKISALIILLIIAFWIFVMTNFVGK